jgi:nucleotide-binding universal stress UspA family protein
LEDLDVFHKILVPLDGSEYAGKALASALQVAKWFNGTITLLHVYSPTLLLPLYLYGDEDVDQRIASEAFSKAVEGIRDAGVDMLTKSKKTVEAEGVPVETLLKEGHVVQEIVQTAQEGRFDLLVLGAKGVSKIREMRLGSVCEKVVRNAPCTVMVVR